MWYSLAPFTASMLASNRRSSIFSFLPKKTILRKKTVPHRSHFKPSSQSTKPLTNHAFSHFLYSSPYIFIIGSFSFSYYSRNSVFINFCFKYCHKDLFFHSTITATTGVLAYSSLSVVEAKCLRRRALEANRRISFEEHSPFQGTTSRWMETPCYTCSGAPASPRQGDWKRHPVWRWWNTTKLSERSLLSPTSSRPLENSWRFLKTVKVFLPFLNPNAAFFSSSTVVLLELCIHAIS